MAMRNPYAAYQRYATNANPQVLQKEEPVKNNLDAVPKKQETGMAPMPFMGNKGAANNYLENSVLTATPEELTLMLYDGAIKFMNQAIIYIDIQNIEKTNSTLVRAQDIILELMSTLNMDYEVSKYLYSLYDYIKSNLLQANVKKDTQLIRDMISFTRELRDAWAEAMKIAKKG